MRAGIRRQHPRPSACRLRSQQECLWEGGGGACCSTGQRPACWPPPPHRQPRAPSTEQVCETFPKSQVTWKRKGTLNHIHIAQKVKLLHFKHTRVQLRKIVTHWFACHYIVWWIDDGLEWRQKLCQFESESGVDLEYWMSIFDSVVNKRVEVWELGTSLTSARQAVPGKHVGTNRSTAPTKSRPNFGRTN